VGWSPCGHCPVCVKELGLHRHSAPLVEFVGQYIQRASVGRLKEKETKSTNLWPGLILSS